MTAASPGSYLLFDRSQEVGGGGGNGGVAAAVRREGLTTLPLSDRHGPFPLCVPLLHPLHLAAIVQNLLAAEAPSLTLQKDNKPVRMWTRRKHSENQSNPQGPLSVSKCDVTGNIFCTIIIILQGYTLTLTSVLFCFLNLCNISAGTHNLTISLHYFYNAPMETCSKTVAFYAPIVSVSIGIHNFAQ